MTMSREDLEALEWHTTVITNIELLMHLDGQNQSMIAKEMKVAQSDVSNIHAGKRTLTALWINRFSKALKVVPAILTQMDFKGAIMESIRNPIFEDEEPETPKKKRRKKRPT